MYYQDHAKSIKGLSIAVLVLSILTIAGCIIGIIFGSTLWPVMDHYLSSGGYNNYYYDGNITMTPSQALGIGLGAFVGLMIWGIITAVVTLVTGIFGLRTAGVPQSYGPLTVWSVIGAIVSFCCGRIAEMVLLIIIAVFSSKDRRVALDPTAGIGYDPNYAQPYAQPPYGQQPYGQQPYAPGAMPPQGQGYVPPQGQGYGQPYNQTATGAYNVPPQGTPSYGQYPGQAPGYVDPTQQPPQTAPQPVAGGTLSGEFGQPPTPVYQTSEPTVPYVNAADGLDKPAAEAMEAVIVETETPPEPSAPSASEKPDDEPR